MSDGDTATAEPVAADTMQIIAIPHASCITTGRGRERGWGRVVREEQQAGPWLAGWLGMS